MLQYPELAWLRSYPTILKQKPAEPEAPSNGHGSQLIKAFEQAWSAIQKNNPDVPDVLIVTGRGRIPLGLILGAFSERSWKVRAGEQAEMFVGGEGLERGPRDVFATLIHEAAHGMAVTRKIKDTSRQFRYHNAKYKALAEEIGIEVTQDPDIGWSITTLPDRTAKLYADEIDALGKAFAGMHRKSAVPWYSGNDDDDAPIVSGGDKIKFAPTAFPTKPRTVFECACSPARRIRIGMASFEAGPITCGVCHADFEAKEITS